MTLGRDERAVSVVIGAVLMLAIVVAALAIYQTTVVPGENGDVEAAHNEEITGDLVELRSAIANAASEETARSVPLGLGTTYETRSFAINPPDPMGAIESERMDENVTIEIDGDERLDVASHVLRYEPGYHEFDGPTSYLEHGHLHQAFSDGTVSVVEPMFGASTATIPIVDGEVAETTSGTVSVDVETIEPRQTAAIDEYATVTVPTHEPDVWAGVLDETDGVSVTDSGVDWIAFELDGEYFDTVAVAGIGVGEPADGVDLDSFGDPGQGVDPPGQDR